HPLVHRVEGSDVFMPKRSDRVAHRVAKSGRWHARPNVKDGKTAQALQPRPVHHRHVWVAQIADAGVAYDTDNLDSLPLRVRPDPDPPADGMAGREERAPNACADHADAGSFLVVTPREVTALEE